MTPAPSMTPVDCPFWGYVQQGQLRMQRCRVCGQVVWPAAPVCYCCLATELSWEPLSGEGAIASFVVYRRQYLPAFPPPYCVAEIDLAEGPRYTSNLVGPGSEQPLVGAAVRVVFRHEGGVVLPQFELAT